MKELSIEEKAKAYDEAVINGSRLWEGDIITRESYEYIFPELKESKDERIRKAIYNCVKWFGFDSCFFKDASQEECLSWLEKQGENNMGISEATKQKLEDNLNKALEKETPESCNEFLEKQGEQNHTDKFPKYDKGDILTDGKNKYEVLSWDYTETGIAAYYMKGVGCKFSWNCEEADKKLYIVEQKPVDKVEPKFKVGDIIKPKDGGYEPWQIMQVDILDKKYRLKKGYVIHFSQEDDYELVEQNTAWSEEDERIFNNINLYIRKAGDYPHFNKENIKEAINWLKSLKERYTWKPSDEQMKCLSAAIEESNENSVLESLLSDLKKLRKNKL